MGSRVHAVAHWVLVVPSSRLDAHYKLPSQVHSGSQCRDFQTSPGFNLFRLADGWKSAGGSEDLLKLSSTLQSLQISNVAGWLDAGRSTFNVNTQR